MENNRKEDSINSDVKYIGISNFEQFRENPFIPNLLFPRGNKNITIAKTDKAIMSRETGEIEENTLFIGVKKELDKDQFVKIFHSQLQVIFDLSKAALKVFGYIASVTEFGDKILFDLEDCKNYTGYKGLEAIYKGISELLNAEMIARTKQSNVYFINPQVFYKGDRIVLVTEYRKKREKYAIDPNQGALFNQ